MRTKYIRKGGIWIVSVFLFLLIALGSIYYLRKGNSHHATIKSQYRVAIEQKNGQYHFLKDGRPFLIKGGAGYSFMKELSMYGGNTIVCWDTSKLAATLTLAEENNLSVIIGLDIPNVSQFDIYKDPNKLSALYNACKRIVTMHKGNRATFAWCLGNELIFPFSPKYDIFYTFYNQLLDMIHAEDPDHPVCTAIINVKTRDLFNIQWRIPALDFIGFNLYNSITHFQEDIDNIRFFWRGPYMISEWAPRGGWESKVTSWQAPFEESSTVKAQEYFDFYKQYMPVKDSRFLGSMAFYWGSRQEYTYTFYSIFNDDGIPTEIGEALNDAWKDTVTVHHAPAVTAIAIDDSLVTKDNILLAAGSPHTAAIALKKEGNAEDLQYSWQILKESWATWNTAWVNFKKPLPETNLIADGGRQQISFTAPLKEGPYRIFITVYNSNGYCATANIPFYVIQ